MQFFRKLNNGFKKVIIRSFYNNYVLQSSSIQMDVEQTFLVRGCQAKKETIKKKFEHLMLYYPEFAFIFFWRIKKKNHFFASLFIDQEYLCKIFGSTKIKGGLVCYHPFSTVINAKTIGENFQFRNGLTIGNKGNDNSLVPIIGDNVTVGTNVVIIGGITIGDRVVIGAGSVVVKDVPPDSVIAGNPAQVLKSTKVDENLDI